MLNRLLLLAIAVAMVPAWAQPASPFAMNGWQFHSYDIPKVELAIRKAPEYGVNFFIFSHGLFRSVEGYLQSDPSLDPKRPMESIPKLRGAGGGPGGSRIRPGYWEKMQGLCRLADQVKIPYYMWIHEFDDIPDRFLIDGRIVDFDNPGLFPYIEDRYERLLKAVPGTAGFVLTLHESDYPLFRNATVRSKYPVPERMYRTVKLIYDVAKRHNKQFILRTFLYEPKEFEWMSQAIARLPDDVTIMSKDTPHEFDPFYPWDPMHGKMGKKKHIVEIDLGMEKSFERPQAHYVQAEYVKRAVQHVRDLKLAGMVGRCQLWDHPFEDTHEANLYAFSRFMQNPDEDLQKVMTDWASKRYPAKAVPHIVSALNRTQFVNHHGRYFLRFWLMKQIGVQWNDYEYYFGHLLMRSRSKWTNDPEDKKMLDALYNPDRATFDKLVAEKDEVIRQAKLSIADMEAAVPFLTPAQAESLWVGFRFNLDAAQLMHAWTRAYFAQRMFVLNPRDTEAERIANTALAEMEKLDASPTARFGLNPRTGHRHNIDHFVLEMRWRMQNNAPGDVLNRNRAIAEDERILEGVRRYLDVEKN